MGKSSRTRKGAGSRAAAAPAWEDVPLIPEVGEDGLQVVRGGSGRAFFQPVEQRGAWGLSGPKQAALADLQEHAAAVQSMREHLADLVEECREQGLSWSLIGWSLGVTAEGARKAYGRAREGEA